MQNTVHRKVFDKINFAWYSIFKNTINIRICLRNMWNVCRWHFSGEEKKKTGYHYLFTHTPCQWMITLRSKSKIDNRAKFNIHLHFNQIIPPPPSSTPSTSVHRHKLECGRGGLRTVKWILHAQVHRHTRTDRFQQLVRKTHTYIDGKGFWSFCYTFTSRNCWNSCACAKTENNSTSARGLA